MYPLEEESWEWRPWNIQDSSRDWPAKTRNLDPDLSARPSGNIACQLAGEEGWLQSLTGQTIHWRILWWLCNVWLLWARSCWGLVSPQLGPRHERQSRSVAPRPQRTPTECNRFEKQSPLLYPGIKYMTKMNSSNVFYFCSKTFIPMLKAEKR